jgi:hypothetical protein
VSTPRLSPDAKAVVRAAEALTAQVRRIADAVEKSPVEVDEAVMTSVDRASTSEREAAYKAVRAYIRQLSDSMPTGRVTRNAIIWQAVGAALDAHTLPADTPAAAEPTEGPPCSSVPGCDGQCCKRAPATAEDGQRTARRTSIRSLLSSAICGTLRAPGGELLRQHVEAEIREADTARAIAAGNKRHVQVMYGELTAAQAAVERGRAEVAKIRAVTPTWHPVADLIDAALDGQPTDPATAKKAGAWARTAAVREAEAYNAAVVLDPKTSSPADAMMAVETPVTTGMVEGVDRQPEPASSPLREHLADTVRSALRQDVSGDLAEHIADAVLVSVLSSTGITGALARMSEADVPRVIALYERWRKAGPPPLGTSISRWWDKRLLELQHAVFVASADQPETPS